jgi:carboxyl-terminal processing protease
LSLGFGVRRSIQHPKETRVKRIRLLVSIALVASFTSLSAVFASPATDLFREASFYLDFYYFGFSQTKPKDLIAKYQPQLEAACKATGDACPYEVARGIIERMIGDLDDGHTYLLSPDAYARTQGADNAPVSPTYGISLPTINARGEALITDVRTGSAAEEAGLLPWDRITSVNGEKLQPTTDARAALEAFRNKIRVDTPVKFGIARGEVTKPTTFEVTMQRRINRTPALPYLYQPASAPKGVFVLRIPDFGTYNRVGPRVHELVKQAQAKNATAIIVDLEDNPGGELKECTTAVGAFVGDLELAFLTRFDRQIAYYKAGTVFEEDPQDPRKGYTLPDPARWTGKVAVLVNDNSASCSEEFAYNIQRTKRGPVIGETTAGVLNTATTYFPLIDRGAIAVTIVRAVLPDGTVYPEAVTPDVPVSFDLTKAANTGRDPLLEKAIETLGLK